MTEAELASEIAAHVLQEPVTEAAPRVGKGIVNRIYVVTAGPRCVVVRMNPEEDIGRTLQDYTKEAWCIAQAAQAGIRGPEVLAVGRTEATAYMVQSCIPGENGTDSALDPDVLWRTLGEYAKRIHALPVTGFGEILTDAEKGVFGGSFTEDWRAFVDYNLSSLTDDDPLLRLGVLTNAQREPVRTVFEELRDKAFTIGLNHGDLTIRNVVVTPDCTVHLLDWGSASADIVPHSDFMGILWYYEPKAQAWAAFLEGYGMSAETFALLKPELDSLYLLKSFDLVRWAIDRHPSALPEKVTRAKEAFQQKFGAQV